MIRLIKRKKVTFLDVDWSVIGENIKMGQIPRIDELIYITSKSQYYTVLKVIHNVSVKNDCNGVFVILVEYDGKLAPTK